MQKLFIVSFLFISALSLAQDYPKPLSAWQKHVRKYNLQKEIAGSRNPLSGDQDYAEPIPSRSQQIAETNKHLKKTEGKIKFQNGNSINVKGSHVDPKTGDYIYTGRSQRIPYPRSYSPTGNPGSYSVQEKVRISGKTDSLGRHLVIFEDIEGGPEYYWVPPEQLGIQKK